MLTASLPPALERALAEQVDGRRREASGLTRSYARPGRGPVATTKDAVAAYATTRLPATYAATRVVLGELAARCPWFGPETQLDVGAGPGSALWAAADTWPTLARATAVEAEPAMIELGRSLAAASDRRPVAHADWRRGRLPDAIPDEPADLVTLAYVLAELDDEEQAATVERAWRNATALVVVEPGTPDGYRRMLAARDRLLARDATLAAPCPHDRACPWAGTDEWCHFAVRLPRSAAHRRAKAAERGHEDEKLSYVAVVRGPAERAWARVLRHPQQRPGHVLTELCTDRGIVTETISRRDRERYARARKASWGDDLG